MRLLPTGVPGLSSVLTSGSSAFASGASAFASWAVVCSGTGTGTGAGAGADTAGVAAITDLIILV